MKHFKNTMINNRNRLLLTAYKGTGRIPSRSGLSFILTTLFFAALFFSCNTQKKEKNNTPATAVSPADSLRLLSQEIKNDSTDYTLYLKRSQLYLRQNKIDPCLRDLGRALQLNNTDPKLFYVLSDAYFILGKIQQSIDALKKAIKLQPKNEYSYVKLARLYLILKDYRKAVTFSDKALLLNPDDARIYFIKALVNVEQGDTAQSVKNLKVAVNLDTAYFEAVMQLGTVLSMRADSSAIGYFKRALKLRPYNHAAFYGLGMAYQNAGKIDSALIIYDSVLKLNQTDPQIYFNKGYIYLVEKPDYKKAEQAFKRAIELDSTYVEAVYNLGRVFEAERKTDRAVFYYRRALELVPNYPLAVAGLNRIEK